jgi:hypothetical protein
MSYLGCGKSDVALNLDTVPVSTCRVALEFLWPWMWYYDVGICNAALHFVEFYVDIFRHDR